MKVRVEMEMDVEVGDIMTNANFKHSDEALYKVIRIDADRQRVQLQQQWGRKREPFHVSFRNFLMIYKKRG